jgi:signal transduction histidine kinase
VNQDSETSVDEVGSLLHDLRNLLAVILNYSELIAGEAADPGMVRADIAEVRAAAAKAISLTEKLHLGGSRPPAYDPPAGLL